MKNSLTVFGILMLVSSFVFAGDGNDPGWCEEPSGTATSKFIAVISNCDAYPNTIPVSFLHCEACSAKAESRESLAVRPPTSEVFITYRQQPSFTDVGYPPECPNCWHDGWEDPACAPAHAGQVYVSAMAMKHGKPQFLEIFTAVSKDFPIVYVHLSCKDNNP